MKPFKYVLKSLFNNSVIVEGRKRKWIESFIVFCIAMIIALIPTVISIASIKGSSIITANSNAVDEGLIYFSETMKNKEMSFKIKDDLNTKIIVIEESSEKWGEDPNCFNNRDKDRYFFYERSDRTYNEDGSYKNENVERLRVYLSIDLDNNGLSEKVKALQSQDTTPITSFLIIGKTSSFLAVYDKKAESWDKPDSTRYLTYDRFESGQEVISSFTGTHSLDSWSDFIDTAYTSTKITSLFTQIGIYASINLIVALFATLMIFILTRGKRNPYRDCKFTEAMKMVGIASLTPSIISALAGFILPGSSSMLFMFILAMRIVWLTSRNLSPVIDVKK